MKKLFTCFFLFSLIGLSSVFGQIPTNGLIGWYPFNGNANDESGNGNNCTATGVSLTTDRFGNTNSAYVFAGGINSYIQTPISSNVSSPDFTISCWAKGTQSVANSAIVAARNTTDRITSIGYESGTTGTYLQIATSSTTVGCGANNDNFDGSWHHFVVKFGNNTSYIYVDGILKNSCSQTIIPVITAQFKIGLDDLSFGGIPRGFIGSIDEVGFWNRALSQQEITAIYQNGQILNPTITLDSPSSIQQNDTVEVSVNTTQLQATDGIVSYQFKLAYDNTRLSYLSSTLVGTINSTGTLNVNSTTAGMLNIGGINQNNITGIGSLVKIKFIATTTLGNAQFTLSNFLYNTNPVTDLVNDAIEIIDGIPPTGAITYSINPAICREGENILITVTYNENMADAPIPQISLSGVNTLANTNLTKVNSTVYTYDYLVQHGSGDVFVHLFTGTDIVGNIVVETPTSGTYFTILPTKYGDIDTNTFVQAYDAALALQYSVGIDPLPTSDPLPWSNWRKIVANVDATGDITANDASLILQYSIELINTFPVEGTKSVLENPIADINISQVNNELILSSTGEFYGLNIFANNGSTVTLGTPIITDQTMLKAFNITGNTYNVGVCISTSPTDNTEIMRIPFTCTISETLTFNMLINKNAVTKTINVNAVGISENKMNSVNIYPNPANDKMIIEGLQNSIIEIINNQGQTVKTLNISNNKTTIDLTKISGGIYTMKIKSENGIIVKKLIKQ